MTKQTKDGAAVDEPGEQHFPKRVYERELLRLQEELVKMSEWVKDSGARVVVVFEGRDAAGKGGAIKRITEHVNPRIARVVALPAPTERQRTQWYFQRYVDELPAAGEIVLLDRSWYNRAGVEKVLGFCTPEEHRRFLRQCPIFERLLVEDGIHLIKYWFSVSDAEQERRFEVAHRRSDAALEAVGHRPVLTDALRRLLPREGRDVRAHRHPGGAVVRRRGRRQEEGPAELHRAPAHADPVRGEGPART